MARIRSVKPELCTSETMAAVSAVAERTFVRLWTHCDDEGRCKDNPKLLKAALFPLHDDVTAADLDDHLWELAEHGLIVRYEVAGALFLHVPSWREHQKPQKRQESKLPTPESSDDLPVQVRSRSTTRPVPESYGPVVEGRGRGVVVGEVEVGVADPVHIGGQLPVVAETPTLDAEQIEQLTNRAVGLLANLRSLGGDNPGALARHIGENLPDHERAELRALVADGMDPRDAAAALADPLRGMNPAIGTRIDPAAVAEAAERAKRAEAKTAAALAEQRAGTRSAPPADLRTHLRPPAVREAQA